MSEPRRLHPLYILFMFTQVLRSGIIPIIVFIFTVPDLAGPFQKHEIIILGAIAGIILIVVPSWLSWYRYTYRVVDGELRIDYGVFVRKHRYIRKERIQSIDESAGILHRLFNLIRVKIETAGGAGEPEVKLTAITKQESEALRKTLSDKSNEDFCSEKLESERDEPELQYKVRGKDLLIAGATSGKIGVVLSVIGGIFSQADSLIPEHFYSDIFRGLLESGIAFIGLLLLITALLAWVLAIFGTIIRFAGFTLTLKGDELILVHGLLERRQLTIPRKRIQAIRIVEGMMRQPFGFAALYVESAGGGGKENEYSTVLFPIMKMNEVLPFLERTVPDLVVKGYFQSPPKRALRRYVSRLVVPVIAAAVPVAVFVPWGGYFFVFVLLAAGLGCLKYKDAGWFLDKEHAMLRFRGLSRTTVMVPKKRIQASETRQSFFQKKSELVTYQISVTSSLTGKNFKVKDLAEKDGAHLLKWYVQETGEG